MREFYIVAETKLAESGQTSVPVTSEGVPYGALVSCMTLGYRSGSSMDMLWSYTQTPLLCRSTQAACEHEASAALHLGKAMVIF